MKGSAASAVTTIRCREKQGCTTGSRKQDRDMRDGRTMTKSTPQLMKSRVGTCADRPPCCGGCCCLLDYFWYDCGRSATFSPSTCSPARHAKRCRERLHPENPLRRKSLVARQPHETVRFFFFARAACCTSLLYTCTCRCKDEEFA